MSYVEQLRRQKQLEHLQKDEPWGKDQADAIAEFGTNVMEGVVGGVTDWWKRSSADQEGWFDDALRLAAGGVKNVAAAAEDQEGYLDDALRLAGGGVKNTLNVIGAPGYIGSQIGGTVIGALGGDRRLGEWGGGFLGDAVLGGYAAKGLKVARAGTQYARLSPFQRALQYGSTSGAMASPVKYGGEGLEAFAKGAKIAAKKEFAGEIALAGKIKDADTLMQVEGLKEAAKVGYRSGLPVPKIGVGSAGRTAKAEVLSPPGSPKGSGYKRLGEYWDGRKSLTNVHHGGGLEDSGRAVAAHYTFKTLKEGERSPIVVYAEKHFNIKGGNAKDNLIDILEVNTHGTRATRRDAIFEGFNRKVHPQTINDMLRGSEGKLNLKYLKESQYEDLVAWKKRFPNDPYPGFEDKRTIGRDLFPEINIRDTKGQVIEKWRPQNMDEHARRFHIVAEKMGIDERISLKKFKVDPRLDVYSSDHSDVHRLIEHFQGTNDGNPLSLLEEAIQSGRYENMNIGQAAEMYANAHKFQERIAANVLKLRYNKIEDMYKRFKKAGILKRFGYNADNFNQLNKESKQRFFKRFGPEIAREGGLLNRLDPKKAAQAVEWSEGLEHITGWKPTGPRNPKRTKLQIMRGEFL